MLSIVLWVAPILAGFVAAQDTSKLVVPAFVDLSRKGMWEMPVHILPSYLRGPFGVIMDVIGEL